MAIIIFKKGVIVHKIKLVLKLKLDVFYSTLTNICVGKLIR